MMDFFHATNIWFLEEVDWEDYKIVKLKKVEKGLFFIIIDLIDVCVHVTWDQFFKQNLTGLNSVFLLLHQLPYQV